VGGIARLSFWLGEKGLTVEQVIAVLQSEGRDSFRLIARHFVRPQAEHWHDNTVIQRHSKRKARRNLGGV